MRALAGALLLLLALPARADAPVYATVVPGVVLGFPADHGAHPGFRTEWWYITGWLYTADGPLGFQVTFFRTRPGTDQSNPSAFSPKQILLAHAALSDPKLRKTLVTQRAAREGFGLAEASTGDTDIVLDDWLLKRGSDGSFRTHAGGKEFTLDLDFTPAQAILLEGDNGYSRKGPDPAEASYYYSLPQLKASGTVTRAGRAVQVTGSAWLDREWSSSYLNPNAVGWDWAGLNLDDGGAVMAFQIRDSAGNALWAGGTMRSAKGETVRLAPEDVGFTAVRRWRSPATGATYPVEQTLSLRLPAGPRSWRLTPLLDASELDTRVTGGPVYWEGPVQTLGGRGYLELTGYATPVKF